ncbi:hypothetical protein [Cellulophaga baltica]|uniref:hypothetical protein n=1 Tax=Cellulophaga baltica TaxID=76594 RepID=UPI0015F6DE0E|nr:hypothetical protein [Cellulophaga baltica]MBA6313873.1 hypothetical protein [Cellulophaga baltica]
MKKIDIYLYKKAENIENKSISTLIGVFIILLNLGSVFMAVWLLAKYIPESPFIYFIYYLPLLIFTYCFSKSFKFLQYINTNAIRKKIFLENEKGKSITEWRYTKREWSRFKQEPISSIKRQRLKNYSILISICVILFLVLELFFSLMIITLILSFSVSSIVLSDIYSQNWKRILERDEVNVIFSKSGIVISKLYTYPSFIENRRLIKVKNDLENNTILFEYSIFSPRTSDSSDSVYTEHITFPVIERYKLDVNKIIKGINTYSAFEIK